MDSGTCRSGRTGSAPRDETFGYARGLEEGHRLRGEMRQPLCGKKRVRRDTERGVMVESPPASPFKMIEPQLVLQLLVVSLDAPAEHRELDQLGARRRQRQRGQPILDRGGLGARPGAHTVVSVLMPTTYGIACAVSASRKAVTTP